MADDILAQSEADRIFALPKHAAEETVYPFPQRGDRLNIPLVCDDRRVELALDVRRGSIALEQMTYQNRAHRVVVLRRLDLAGPPHTNPDGEDLPCPHLHIYREGYGDKWAVPVPLDEFSDTEDLWQALKDFMEHCSILTPPQIRRTLFDDCGDS